MSRQPVQAKVTATIQAPLGSPERGLLVLGGLCFAVFAFGLWRISAHPLAIASTIAGMAGIVAVLVVGMRDGRRFGHVGAPVRLAQTGNSISIMTEVEPSRAIE